MKTNLSSLLLLFAFLFMKPCTTKAQVNVQDSLALVDLYNSTDGPHWNNNFGWLTVKPVWQWSGVDVYNGRVSGLNIGGLTGDVPVSFGNLTGLQSLYASGQFSSNPIIAISNCTQLVVLSITNSNVTSIPSQISKLVNLQGLYLHDNQLSGSMPPEIGNLSNLTALYLYNNQLSGSIPVELAHCTKLFDLHLEKNQLTGSIPRQLGNLEDLHNLRLSDNQLSGKIPVRLQRLKKLNWLDLDHNQLSGKIPEELAGCDQLWYLILSNNQLTGSIPPQLSNLKQLKWLLLSNNKLRDTIPSNLTNLPELEKLDLSYNLGLSGTIPASFSNFTKLRTLRLNKTGLAGPVPVFLSDVLYPLGTLEIMFNSFNFDGIETLAQKYFMTFEYGGQKKINIHQNNNKLSVYAGGTLSNNTYSWYKDKILISTITGDSTFTPSENGSYTVVVSNAIAKRLKLRSNAITFTGINKFEQNNITALQESDKTGFSIYPNPAKTTTAIAFNATGNCVIKITDVSGRVLQTKTIIAATGKSMLQLDVSKYAAGVYFVTISNDQNKTYTRQLIKK